MTKNLFITRSCKTFILVFSCIFALGITLSAAPLQTVKTTTIMTPTAEQKAKIATQLNGLLADLSIFYQNTRGLHWNVKGDHFFELHAKYEELYNDLLTKVDEVAERILALGHAPLVTYDEYKKIATLTQKSGISDATQGVKLVVESLEAVMNRERALLKPTAEAGDDGTNDLMVNYIGSQEKLVWMYKAFLKK